MVFEPPKTAPRSATESRFARLAKESRARIYRNILKSGGDPSGAPWGYGLSTLTLYMVKALRQRGYFAFPSRDANSRREPSHRFTKYGASPFTGTYEPPPEVVQLQPHDRLELLPPSPPASPPPLPPDAELPPALGHFSILQLTKLLRRVKGWYASLGKR